MAHPIDIVNEPAVRVALRAAAVRPWRRRRFHSFGQRSAIDRPLALYGPWQISIGDNVMILRGAWLSAERQAWEAPAPVLRIGDHVAVRPHCTISAAESVTIESHVVLSAFTTVLDSDHRQVPGVASVLWTPLATSPTRIGAGTWVGERTTIMRGSDIGRQCIIGANSIVRGKIPDYSVAVGAPARVVRRLEGFEA